MSPTKWAQSGQIHNRPRNILPMNVSGSVLQPARVIPDAFAQFGPPAHESACLCLPRQSHCGPPALSYCAPNRMRVMRSLLIHTTNLVQYFRERNCRLRQSESSRAAAGGRTGRNGDHIPVSQTHRSFDVGSAIGKADSPDRHRRRNQDSRSELGGANDRARD